ncbi:GNAT family N-acetyltransferase [Cohnella thailandensis]|uniref:GNAT family N-acetyltransferase n=1 Tax=Cohnella thailandensis TaxID=557557 RepID=A0A841SUJ7_9BACL|nr:GNAT family N-acetyltransferase [Cohnella thailandensis]MBB6633550.1 GNAT family N-acetyltransferase [Cohnella thailandensis]MBP1974567.1 ribosomal protein S18 acetylase RimI-like enzyme [Cohnella thailandensis]
MPTNEQLRDIERLQLECEAYDHVQLKLNWSMLGKRTGDELDFLLYEGAELIAFLGLYPFASTVEVCGMVKPSERRKGHFGSLFKQGMARAREHGFEKILLNAPSESVAAREFLARIGAEYAFSEHQMEWEARDLDGVAGVELRPAEERDMELRVRLNVEAFRMSEADSRALENEQAGEGEVLIIEADKEPVGKIRVSRKDGQAWIYGFCVLQERQGRGIGRQALRRIVGELSSEGYSVHLEVEAKNDHALGLYRSVGFRAVHSQDYYSWPIE